MSHYDNNNMDKVVEQLAEFEKNHHSWEDKKFLNIQTKEAKEAVEEIYRTNEAYINELAAKGTDMELVAFVNKVKKQSPRMILFVLSCFLDLIHKREEASQDISREIVKWYRYEGWKFPLFDYEKKNIVRLEYEN